MAEALNEVRESIQRKVDAKKGGSQKTALSQKTQNLRRLGKVSRAPTFGADR